MTTAAPVLESDSVDAGHKDDPKIAYDGKKALTSLTDAVVDDDVANCLLENCACNTKQGTWGHTTVSPGNWWQGWEAWKFKGSLGYIAEL